MFRLVEPLAIIETRREALQYGYVSIYEYMRDSESNCRLLNIIGHIPQPGTVETNVTTLNLL